MGTGYAGTDGSVEISDDDSTYVNFGGANSVSFDQTHETLDVSDFTDDFFARIMGLSDVNASISGNYDDTDAGQVILETQFDAKALIYLKFTSGSGGSVTAAFYCTSLSVTSAPDGKEEFSAELVGGDGQGVTRA